MWTQRRVQKTSLRQHRRSTFLCEIHRVPEYVGSSFFVVGCSYGGRLSALLRCDSSSSASRLDICSNVSPNQRQGEPNTRALGSTQSQKHTTRGNDGVQVHTAGTYSGTLASLKYKYLILSSARRRHLYAWCIADPCWGCSDTVHHWSVRFRATLPFMNTLHCVFFLLL